MADRQVEFRGLPLDRTVPADHRVRSFVALVEPLDLSAFSASIHSFAGRPGRPAADPRVLVLVWLYAMDQGVDSARKLAKLCQEHDAYRWLLGGVSTNHHQLSDFRVLHPVALRDVFEQVLVRLEAAGLCHIERQALDGTKSRASAGAASFRREPRLRRVLQDLGRRGRAHRPPRSPRKAQAQARSRKERRDRVNQALRGIPAARRAKKLKERDEARVSTTDPEARVMKMADGGFRPAYNVQVSSTTQERIITKVTVTSQGTDMGLLEPMQRALEKEGRLPDEQLMDGGYVKLSDVTKAEARGSQVYAPEQKQKQSEAHQPKADDTEEVAQWRVRMGQVSAKEIYKERASAAECVNADLKSHGLVLRVRGLEKVLQVGLWVALAHNIRSWLSMLRQRFTGDSLQFLHSL